MTQKISAELSVVAATAELEKTVAAELHVADGDLKKLLEEEGQNNDRCSPEDDTQNLS